MTAGPEADDPACAQFTVDLGRKVDVLGGFDRVWTDAQATAAWGTPSAILVTCGAEPVVASSNVCQSVGGVDWIIDNSDPKAYLMTSFSTSPTVAVYLDLDALQQQQVDQPGSDSDPASVIERLTRVMKDQKVAATQFADNGRRCTERP